MLFNSPVFIVFLVVVFLVYWRLGTKNQNRFLLVASYVFYGWWDWRFLLLLLGSSVADFYLAGLINRSAGRKRLCYLLLSLVSNLGVLVFFKYFNFFTESFTDLVSIIGLPITAPTLLNIVLPVGISFYTFQSLGYTIDVYRGVLKPESRLLNFLAFVAFFPQLVAGPIERATNLLGQFSLSRTFDRELASDGARQMLWGFFKKIVVADNLAVIVNQFYNSDSATGGQLWVATIFFAFQIYCDFSGYTDIAIGCAKLFGFRLMRNFAYPYFSRNLVEFWRRWHISLSSWFKDYVFFPLGGNRVRAYWKYVRNILIVFLISGLWHGASLTFIVWGLWHGLGYLWLASHHKKQFAGPISQTHRLAWSTWVDALSMIFTFFFVSIGWVFFRALDLSQALLILNKMLASVTGIFDPTVLYPKRFLLVLILLVVEWLARRYDHALAPLAHWPRWRRWCAYYVVVIFILFFGAFDYTPFIYFQF